MSLQTRGFGQLLSGLVILFGCGGCSLMGGLRPDLDDQQASFDAQPTVGGAWAERGFLDDSVPEGGDGRYGSLGHSERAPAGMGGGASQGGDWVDSERANENRRNMARGDENSAEGAQVNFSSNPNLPPPTKRLYKNGNRATKDDFIDESPNEGSLWASDGQTNYYFTKNKIRGVGDIITISMEQGLIRDTGLEIKRTLTDQEKDIEQGLAQERADARANAAAGTDANGQKSDAVATSQAAPAPNPANPAGGASATGAQVTPGDVDVSKSLELKAGDTMMAEITERYPNGNYKIRGTKRVLYKNGSPRLVNLVGVVKGSDISEDDTVPSGKLYEYRLEAIR